MTHHHAFMSYAGEDEQLAHELVGGLKTRGFEIWYARLSLKVGHILLDEIGKGINTSKAGILLISKAYLQKPWTNYEMDALFTQHIETAKTVLPVWHGVSKKEVGDRHPGLAGRFALMSDIGVRDLVEALSSALAEHAPTRAVTPIYASPKFRFLHGDGELTAGPGGPAFTIWEALLHMKDHEYPIWIDDELFPKWRLLREAARAIAANPDRARNCVRELGLQQITAMCKEAGFDPSAID